MLNLFDYDFGVRLIKPDPNIYYRTKEKPPAFAGGFVMYQGFLISTFSTSAPKLSPSSRAKGALYPPLVVSKLPQAVAIKEEPIRLKFIMEKLVGKCFAP